MSKDLPKENPPKEDLPKENLQIESLSNNLSFALGNLKKAAENASPLSMEEGRTLLNNVEFLQKSMSDYIRLKIVETTIKTIKSNENS